MEESKNYLKWDADLRIGVYTEDRSFVSIGIAPGLRTQRWIVWGLLIDKEAIVCVMRGYDKASEARFSLGMIARMLTKPDPLNLADAFEQHTPPATYTCTDDEMQMVTKQAVMRLSKHWDAVAPETAQYLKGFNQPVKAIRF